MFPTRSRAAKGLSVLAVSLSLALAAQAQGLKIGMSADVTSMDPHFYNATPNNTIAFHVFEALLGRTADGKLAPQLAESWRAISDLEWEFTLRKDARWHDGTPFTAADVIFSLNRLKDVPGAPGGFASRIHTMTGIAALDDHTLRITTATPTPTLPVSLSFIAIVPKANEGRLPEDYNAGTAMIGTGPFRFVRYTAGEGVELARNDDWWGGKADWQQVSFRIIPNVAVRTTSILSGDLDLIEMPNATDLERLESTAGLKVLSVRGDRVAYVNPILVPGEGAEAITDAAGKPIDPTPLQNPLVRKALSVAINRQGLSERVMLGTSTPTGQLLPDGFYSSVPDIAVPTYDPDRARALLAEAGYPDGFKLSLTAANDRVPYNVEVAQAIAQMWTRIGVRTEVNGVPTSVYVRLASGQQIPAYVGSWGNPSMEAGTALTALIHSYDKDRSTGTYNWSRYSNPAFDAKLEEALSTIDDAAREALLQDATRMVLAEDAFIPLYHFKVFWAARDGLSFAPRADAMTLAQDIRLTKN